MKNLIIFAINIAFLIGLIILDYYGYENKEYTVIVKIKRKLEKIKPPKFLKTKLLKKLHKLNLTLFFHKSETIIGTYKEYYIFYKGYEVFSWNSNGSTMGESRYINPKVLKVLKTINYERTKKPHRNSRIKT